MNPLTSAESEGFEPPVPLPVLLISNQTRSTTPAALCVIGKPANPVWECKDARLRVMTQQFGFKISLSDHRADHSFRH